MNSTPYTAPSQYVNAVVSALASRLNIQIDSVYQREAETLSRAKVCYHTGEVDTTGFANDGRKQHEIELRFLVYVPLSGDFELEALDLSTRIERELLLETFNDGKQQDSLRIVSNMPRQFVPEQGFYLRTVTVKQTVRMGGLDDPDRQIIGGILHDIHTDQAY
ncbi:hypothetical protein [Veronia pacifica]|uniref:hypothetical protein n=1 Tax=Veronia pacifica TaxID=1080227 RepID=UPI001112D780|nr:hypothetical protein [Veronia pacifica]